MEKRYQVFISSTYTDLIEERNEVMQALLELECMPAGMELFPASNDTQWNWIKKVIDESDYYIVIVGGRYGSVHPKLKISYTEMEYRYAIESNKPIIAFLHENPDNIAKVHSELEKESVEKLDSFRKLVKSKLCKYYSNSADLGAKVSRSMTQLKKQYPAIGWIKANSLKSKISDDEYLILLKKNESLQKRIKKLSEQQINQSDKYASGTDTIEIIVKCEHRKRNPNNKRSWLKQVDQKIGVKTNWDSIYINLAPRILHKESNYNLLRNVVTSLEVKAKKKLHSKFPSTNNRFSYFNIIKGEGILQQFRVLGLIEINDENNWSLTQYGINYFNNLVAIPKGIEKI